MALSGNWRELGDVWLVGLEVLLRGGGGEMMAVVVVVVCSCECSMHAGATGGGGLGGCCNWEG